MPEDESRKGDRATQRLISLFQGLGWKHKGRTEVDIPCTIGAHTDRGDNHGIDGFLVYDDPYSPHIRGVIVESKARSWENTYEQQVKTDFQQTIGALECAPESDQFDQKLNLEGEASLTNAGILSIWTSDFDEFDNQQFREYVRSLPHPRKRALYDILHVSGI